MPKRFNPNTIKTLYAPRMEYAERNRQGKIDHYTGIYLPTEAKAKKDGERLMKNYPGQFSGFEIITVSADLSSLFDTYAKAIEGGTVE